MASITPQELTDLLHTMGNAPSTEGLRFTELDHALQCAWILWQEAPGDDELALAGLLHDIGHQLGPEDEHAWRGAAMVRPVCGDRVADIVGAHVAAKRYLVATDPAYATCLSPGSTASLALQGGAASAAEVAAWEQDPGFADGVRLRRADDRAKTAGRDVPGIVRWLPLLTDLTTRESD